MSGPEARACARAMGEGKRSEQAGCVSALTLCWSDAGRGLWVNPALQTTETTGVWHDRQVQRQRGGRTQLWHVGHVHTVARERIGPGVVWATKDGWVV